MRTFAYPYACPKSFLDRHTFVHDESSNEIQHRVKFFWNKSCGVRNRKTLLGPALIDAGFFFRVAGLTRKRFLPFG